MKKIQDIKEIIIGLINRCLNKNVVSIDTLQPSGSSRIYFRIFTDDISYVATYNSNIEENNAFLAFSRHFYKAKLPVPEILAVSEDKSCYVQTDLGDISLFSYAQNCIKNADFDDVTLDLYKKSLECLVDFQVNGNVNLDYSFAFPTQSFDRESIIDDLNYFKYYFLKLNDEINCNETRLNHDFQLLADFAMMAPADFFMYRDFQSRNIMVKDDKPYFIDYQGGRKGPLQYDVVSLLYQVKAQLPDEIRDSLLSHYKTKLGNYLNLEDIHFDKYYNTFVLLRLLQVLGAYGFRGLIQKKQHFMESIPYALKEVLALKDRLNLPFEMKELSSVLNQMEMLLIKYQHVDNKKLTVVVNSFSYKNGGVPEDRSGNGGGFVFDCRALPNPGRYKEYKSLTGQDVEVQNFLNDREETHRFFEYADAIISQSVDNYLERDFKNLFVNFGCTGGQHRSVFFAQKIAENLHEKYPQIIVKLNHLVQHKYYVYETK